MPRSRLVALLLAVALVVTTMQLTSGWVNLVTTRGVSMEPTYSQGDLVVTHRTGGYGVGDVIAYRSDELGDEMILHRIVGVRDGRFVTQGDNNDWLDRDLPTEGDVVGQAWFHIPRLGRFVAPIGRLGPLAALVAAGLFFAALSRPRRSPADADRVAASRRRMLPLMHPRIHHLSRLATSWLVAGAVASGIVAVAGYRHGTTDTRPETHQVQHQGRFSYGAPTNPSIVYPDGSIDRGDPVFRTATDTLTLRYDHDIRPSAELRVNEATVEADVLLRIGSWVHQLTSAKAEDLVHGRSGLEMTIDLAAVDELVAQYRAVSGNPSQQVVVAVESRVRGQVTAGHDQAATAFETKLELIVSPNEVGIAAEALDVEGADQVELATEQARYVAAPGLPAVPASHARLWGSGGLAVFGGLLVAALVLRRGAPVTSPILAAGAGRIVEVAGMEPGPGIVDVIDVRAFARVAEETDAVILHQVVDGGAETFIIDAGRLRYRYTTPASPVSGSAA